MYILKVFRIVALVMDLARWTSFMPVPGSPTSDGFLLTLTSSVVPLKGWYAGMVWDNYNDNI